jgi:23S rRNA (cytidine1920-2'-O)/16S rRNA (cytidine1409-2'-O)-methyltransferase
MARRVRSRFVRLVDRLDVDRNEAAQLIQSGQVMVNGIVTRNPHTLVALDAAVTLVHKRTLRGTIKLRAVLAHFEVDVEGQVCLDVGAAAGGFTSALLEAGARKVYAADTGYGQLRGRLRQNRQVVNLERTNLRDLGPVLIPEPISVVCIDLSYVAVASALPQLERVGWAPTAQLLALVKPTFELGAASKVVDDDSITKATAGASSAAESCGWSVIGFVPAPASGAASAPEVFLYARRVHG